jgi:hypothetical protein
MWNLKNNVLTLNLELHKKKVQSSDLQLHQTFDL